jgi:hypothetical protein
MNQVRCIFDAIVEDFPEFGNRLGANADIVHNQDFENGVVKVLSSQINSFMDPILSKSEEVALTCFINPTISPAAAVDVDDNDEKDYVKQGHLGSLKRLKRDPQSKYVNLQWIPPTSNMAERLFSRMKLIFSDKRKMMHPSTMEMIMMLLCNKDCWDVFTVNKIFLRNHKDVNVDDEDNDDISLESDNSDDEDYIF